MKLERGSKLAREESRERRKMRSTVLQDLLDEQLKERQELLKKKAELESSFKKEEPSEQTPARTERKRKSSRHAEKEARGRSQAREGESSKKQRRSEKSQRDIAQAKAKAAKIREQGMKEYKEQLLKELESDRLRKVRVVMFLYVISLVAMLAFYFSNMSLEEIEQMILKAIPVMPEDQDID